MFDSTNYAAAPVAAVAICLAAACSRAPSTDADERTDDRRLYFSNWDGEIGPDTIAEFQRRAGLEVVTEEIVDNVSLETKLPIRGNTDIYPSDEMRQRLHLVPSESHDYARARSRMWTRITTGH